MDLKKAKSVAGYPQLSTTPVLRAAYQLLVDAGNYNAADAITRYLEERDRAMPKIEQLSQLKEFRVTWNQAGSNKGLRVLFVTAGSRDDAEAVARDYIERKHGIASIVVRTVRPADPVPLGSVREGEV